MSVAPKLEIQAQSPFMGEASIGLRDQSQSFIRAVKSAFDVDIATHTPALIPTWQGKTIEMVDSEYEKLSPIAQRSVHILTSLGEAFPKCATLETMTRSVIRANEFQPEKIGKILDRFQGRARKAGNPVLLQSSALLALTPLMTDGKLTNDESDLLRIGIALLPPILAATNVQVKDPQEGFPEGTTVKREGNAFVALGKEKEILDGMRSRGWSEEALKALKEGKSIRRNITPTPFGSSSEEHWKGKDE